jgi:hypothetical protein
VSTTLHCFKPPAVICRERGWTVGTRLVGDEGDGPTVIEITAIGEEKIMAKTISEPPRYKGESNWTLGARDWQPV